MTATAVLSALTDLGVAAQGVCVDSRRVVPGDIFVALPGRQRDGRTYIADAVARGAAAILYEPGTAVTAAVPAVAVSGLAALVGELADQVYRRPSAHLWMAGITGTNGKTSIAQWLAQALARLDCPCGVIGTLGCGFPGAMVEGVNTTPDAASVHRALAELLGRGARACAMEVSSIGLVQHRVAGVRFATAVLTNLTQDHLDFHGSMVAYGEAKEQLFFRPEVKTAVLNLDDPFGRDLADRLAGRLDVIGYSLEGRHGGGRSLVAADFRPSATGISFQLDGVPFQAGLVGRYNGANLLATIGALLAFGHDLETIAGAMPALTPPPGRLQTLGGDRQPLVVVDYAHTPDALEQALRALRETAAMRAGKLICLFGCGGDRDRGKRPLMGSIAERLADRVWLTNDNPRSEDPQQIIADILAGMRYAPQIEPDRDRAIRRAVGTADARDVVLLAGKGHEPYQELDGLRLPFSDLEHAQRALEGRI